MDHVNNFPYSLLSPEGSLVASSGEKSHSEKDAKVTAAIAFHLWQAYLTNTPSGLSPEGPELLLLNCEVYIYIQSCTTHKYALNDHVSNCNFFLRISAIQEGKVAIARVSRLLLCMYADDTAQFGMLKAKVCF